MTKKLALVVSAVLIGLDQLIKYWVVLTIEESTRIPVIPDLFYLSFVKNTGAAFGILQNQTAFLGVVSVLVMFGAVYLIGSGAVKSRFLLWSIAIVLAGGMGNCIDRFWRGYVVDYLDFSALFGFPVFNLADCCVVTGTIMILIFILYTDKGKQDDAGDKQLTKDAVNGKDTEGEAPPAEPAEEQAEAES